MEIVERKGGVAQGWGRATSCFAVPSFQSLIGKNAFVMLPVNGPDGLLSPWAYIFGGFKNR